MLQVLGRALKDLPRDKIIVATKVGRYGADTFDFSAERVTQSVHESLERLQACPGLNIHHADFSCEPIAQNRDSQTGN